MSETVFKPCMQNQPMLFLPDVSDLILANAMVRAVDFIVNSRTGRPPTFYPGGGTSAYDPSMMLKVVIYRTRRASTQLQRSRRPRARTSTCYGDWHAPAGAQTP